MAAGNAPQYAQKVRKLGIGALIVLAFWSLYAMALSIDLIAIEASTGEDVSNARDYATVAAMPLSLLIIALIWRRLRR